MKIGVSLFILLGASFSFLASALEVDSHLRDGAQVNPQLTKKMESLGSTVNKNILIRDLIQVQRAEIKAVENRHKIELKELKISQESHEKEWKKNEDKARHQFFKTHTHGPERRSYIQDFIVRRENLKNLLIQEKNKKKEDQSAQLVNVREKQVLRLKAFQDALEKGMALDSSLWTK